MANHKGKSGVWMVYMYGDGLAVEFITNDPVEAITKGASYNVVGFWPVGMTLAEGVHWWEQYGRSGEEVVNGSTAASSPGESSPGTQ